MSSTPRDSSQPLGLACLSFFLEINALRAQTALAELEGKPIPAINYAPSSFLEPSDLALAQPLKTRDILRLGEVARSIDSLFATGQLEDISVAASSSRANDTATYWAGD
jgi:hypothetical protein